MNQPNDADKAQQVAVMQIIERAPECSRQLRLIAERQIGVPTRLRYEIAAGAVTIEVLTAELRKLKQEFKEYKKDAFEAIAGEDI